MADNYFRCYYHQIFTFDKSPKGKLSFKMEKLSPYDPHFKIDLFQEKIHGVDVNGNRHSNSILSRHADVSNLCKRD